MVSAWVVAMPCGIRDRHDLVVVAVHHQHRDVDPLQILGEVGLGEGLDAVVMRLGAAHHALTPPIVDHPLRDVGQGKHGLMAEIHQGPWIDHRISEVPCPQSRKRMSYRSLNRVTASSR